MGKRKGGKTGKRRGEGRGGERGRKRGRGGEGKRGRGEWRKKEGRGACVHVQSTTFSSPSSFSRSWEKPGNEEFKQEGRERQRYNARGKEGKKVGNNLLEGERWFSLIDYLLPLPLSSLLPNQKAGGRLGMKLIS